MLRLLRNMKVSTKLGAILAAPVIVLIVIATIGVTGRLAEADDARRLEEITDFVQLNSDLIDEVQRESIWSTAYMATLDIDEAQKARFQAEMATQREATDAALVRFQEAAATVQPGSDSEAVAETLRNAETRITNLGTTRNSVDFFQTNPASASEQFLNTTNSLIAVNAALVQTARDPDLLLGLTTVANFERIKNARAHESSLLVPIVVRGAFINREGVSCADVTSEDCQTYTLLVNSRADVIQAEEAFVRFASADDKALWRNVGTSLPIDDLSQQVLEQGRVSNVITVGVEDVTAASFDSLEQLGALDDRFIASVNEQASQPVTDAQNTARLFLLATVLAVIAALSIAFLVARATTVPLRKLTKAAYILSTDKLPGLVERLRNPDEQDEPLSATLSPIDIDSKDEVGQLADAFNSIQQVTVEVAEEQAQLLRKGIGDIFINLARRNQTLLDRQIEFIDQLEANEEDPDQLDNLFKLDHLATRMRRNAESLLVLAGAEPPRRRGRPVSMADVVRVAIGEVEDFARLQLLALDESTVGGNVAVDLAHLLSELMENATHFSPPDTSVEIVGHRADDSRYVLSVSDQGIGMTADQLAEANVALSRPPLVGLAMSRSLGFIVIGRLASRLHVSVKLTASPSGGVTALVTLPADLVTYPGEDSLTDLPERTAPVSEEVVIDQVQEALAAPDPEPEPVLDEIVAEGEFPVESLTATSEDLLDHLVDEVVPEGAAFEQGLQSLVDEELAREPVEPPPAAPVTTAPVVEAPVVEAPVVEAPVVETPAAQAPSSTNEPAGAAPLTAAGLVQRTPKKRSAGDDSNKLSMSAPARSTGQSQRSPEEVRKMLSRYRSGLNKGRGNADPDEKS
jgi:signal transduction histidine kinase